MLTIFINKPFLLLASGMFVLLYIFWLGQMKRLRPAWSTRPAVATLNAKLEEEESW